MLTWAEQMADMAEALVEPNAFGAVAPILNGQPIQAVIVIKELEWLDGYGGSSVRELRYELLVPIAALSAPPEIDDAVVDGSAQYTVTEPGQRDGPFWRAPLRLIA